MAVKQMVVVVGGWGDWEGRQGHSEMCGHIVSQQLTQPDLCIEGKLAESRDELEIYYNYFIVSLIATTTFCGVSMICQTEHLAFGFHLWP